MVVYHNIRADPIYHITHAENFDQLDEKNSCKLANLDDNRGFRGPRAFISQN